MSNCQCKDTLGTLLYVLAGGLAGAQRPSLDKGLFLDWHRTAETEEQSTAVRGAGMEGARRDSSCQTSTAEGSCCGRSGCKERW